MSKLWMASVLVFSWPAMASPNVGDSATYSATEVRIGKTIRMTVIDQITDFKSATNSFRYIETIIKEGEVPIIVDDEWVSATETISDDRMKEMLNRCKEMGGTLETAAVPAGQFQSCRFSADHGEFKTYAVVPFGIVKLADSKGFFMELVKFTRGK